MDTVRNLKAASTNMNKLILDFTQLVDNADQFLLHVDSKIDPLSTGLQATIGDARELLRNVNGKADKLLSNVDREIAMLSTGIQATVGDASKLLKNVDGEVGLVSRKAQDSLSAAKETLGQASGTLKTYENLVNDRSELRNDLNLALSEIAQAARSIRSLTDYLEQHPEALIQGKGSGGR
jgi:paraquat-inducible protein B